MEPFPWKNPRSTPRSATTRIQGARILKAYTLISIDIMVEAMNSAPKKMSRATKPPDNNAKVKAPFSTL